MWIVGVWIVIIVLVQLNKRGVGTYSAPAQSRVYRNDITETIDDVPSPTMNGVSPDHPVVPIVTEPVQLHSVSTSEYGNALWVHMYGDMRKLPVPEWFVGSWVGDLQISPAEQLIIDELVKYRIHWKREVSFRGFTLPTGYHPRYDFYLPDHHIIVEYHGRDWHSTPEKIANDQIKAEFCRLHKVELITWDRLDYYHIENRVSALMDRLGVI